MYTRETDVLVVGGGVNGAGIARDLAGRGLTVVLCEKGDLASATSSASSKMIHGGLRYLEHYDFSLVRSALKEREVLLRSAPHIIWPMNFILPHHKKLRPWWMIRIGLYIYDFLGGKRTLPPSRGLFLTGTRAGAPLKMEFKRGFSYSDCWVEDSRLVALSALDAAERGAEILTRTECQSLEVKDGVWTAMLQNVLTDEISKVRATMVVNAAGPWVANTLKMSHADMNLHKMHLVKGSHMIVPRLYQGDHAYLLQNKDGRVIFVFPYEKRFSLIGTTDVDYKEGDLDEVRISMEEVEYLCGVINEFFRQQIKPEDVEWTYSGVRPLIDDGKESVQKITRDYLLELQEHEGAPIMSIYGGKITTFRKLAEQAGDKVVARLGKGGKAWTADAFLPGADASMQVFDTFLKTFKREYNWLPEPLLYRLARAYGTRARDILRGSKRTFDLGQHLGDNVYECEVRYLVDVEWAMTAEDILWRRSKLGLHVSEVTVANIEKLLHAIMNERSGAA